MNILLYDIGSYIQRDLIYYLKKQGCHCRNLIYKQINLYEDDFFERKFNEQLDKAHYDLVMSTNFFPIVARICSQRNLKYLSWSYDSPVNTACMEYYQFPTSYVFLFDRIDVERVTALGGKNIYHMPLAVNFDRIGKIHITDEDVENYSADISFIGNFYGGPLKKLLLPQDEHDKGYIDALAASQLQIYGYDFIEQLIPDDLISRMQTRLEKSGYHVDGLTKDGLAHSIITSVTRTERLALLNLLGKTHLVRYYSNEQHQALSHLSYGGTAFYYEEMPKIFHLSKLNLCPVLKCIQSGIPLRAIDILGSGGILFSNYQPELAEYFTDGEDVIMYDSIPDALEKADYYLKHENQRLKLLKNVYPKLIRHFSYPDRIASMFKIAGIQ